MAVKVFFKKDRKQDYKIKIGKCEMVEDEWFNHYSLLVSNAYDLESSVGTQTAVSWALCCFKAMPERVPSKRRRLELLINLCFVWYNFTLELKLRCVTEKEEMLRSFNYCRKSFDEMIVKCELEEEDKDVVNSFLNLIKAALLNRISTDHNAEANYLEEFFNTYKECIHFPHVLIALYYYEAASMAYVKGDVVAFDHLDKTFHHLESSSVADNIKMEIFA